MNKLKLVNEEKPWYSEGLHFECTACGQLCTGRPGYVWVDENEIGQIATFLNMPQDKFTRRYLRKVHQRYSLVEYSKSYDCVFLKDKKCSIYPVRPRQCKTFPWWIANLNSPAAWEESAKHCEGIQLKAPLVPFDEIQAQLESTNGERF